MTCNGRDKCCKRLDVGSLPNVHGEAVNSAEANWKGYFGGIDDAIAIRAYSANSSNEASLTWILKARRWIS